MKIPDSASATMSGTGVPQEIDDLAYAESHAWPITNRFDTPLKPTAPP